MCSGCGFERRQTLEAVAQWLVWVPLHRKKTADINIDQNYRCIRAANFSQKDRTFLSCMTTLYIRN